MGLTSIIEAIGRPDTYRAAVEEVCFAGRVVYIGYAKDHVSFETRLFVQKELDIRGSRNALPQDFKRGDPHVRAEAFSYLGGDQRDRDAG